MRVACLIILILGSVELARSAETPEPQSGPSNDVQEPSPTKVGGDGAIPRGREDWERRRREWEALSPEERRARIREFWEKPGRLTGELWEKRRQELKGLSPEERRAKIREWRRENPGHEPEIRKLTPEERQAKRREIGERLEKECKALEVRKQRGEITDPEERRLRHLMELRKRFERRHGKSGGEAGGEGQRSGDGVGRPGKLCYERNRI